MAKIPLTVVNLLTPLDWGLGHASRSLTLADRLEAEGQTVHWATGGQAAEFLKRERPGITVHPLPAYAVRYPYRSMPLNVALQLPKWWQSWRREKCAVAEIAAGLKVDRIISDSRFGCYVPGLTNVFLTHQLHPITGFPPADWLYRYLLRPFDEYWVPDVAGPDNLSGKLSDPAGYENVRFIGTLPNLLPAARPPKTDHPYTLLLLSGPEPARSRLEASLLRQAATSAVRYVLVRGLPASPEPLSVPANVRVYDFADRASLSELVGEAEHIVCRSGYSTLMDLRALGKRATLIPTPGQTEQIYLARRAENQGWAHHVPQDGKRILGP